MADAIRGASAEAADTRMCLPSGDEAIEGSGKWQERGAEWEYSVGRYSVDRYAFKTHEEEKMETCMRCGTRPPKIDEDYMVCGSCWKELERARLEGERQKEERRMNRYRRQRSIMETEEEMI